MCTLSYLPAEEGYALFFNRDERHGRAPEEQLALRGGGAVRWAAPRDGEAGGTWLAANEFGLTVAVLNLYLVDYDPPADRLLSRGALVEELADCVDLEEFALRLNALDARRFRGFTLLAAAPGRAPRCWDWDGFHLVEEPALQARLPLVSSGRDQAAARRERKHAWRELLAGHGGSDAELMEAFHRGHLPERGPWSTCMHREDAETRSFVRVQVDRERVDVRHEAAAPCARVAPVELTLPRRAPVTR